MESMKERKRNIKVVDSSNQREYISDSDAEMDARAVEAVRAAILKAEVCKKPIAKYDKATRKAYVEYPNGSRVDVR